MIIYLQWEKDQLLETVSCTWVENKKNGKRPFHSAVSSPHRKDYTN